jgi:4-hydroxybenzoate polyprenyltransferase
VTERPIGPEARGPRDRSRPATSGASPGKAPDAPASLPDSVADQLVFLRLVFRLAPKSWHPLLQLARVDRPIGWWLLLLPCWWSSALASIYQGGPLRGRDLLLFFIGAVVMRGAGSTYNDIIDRDIDAKVERTKWRPLAAGRITVKAAALFLAVQCLAGFAVLLMFNGFTILLGFASLGIVGIYPFMKRFSSAPQGVLGPAFAWGALMGWAAAFGSLARAPLWLFAAAAHWTLGYDTIYAVQDIKDDDIADIGSMARIFRGRARFMVGTAYALAVCFIEFAFLEVGVRAPAQIGLLLFALHLAWQVVRFDPADGALALRLFRSNRDAGLMLFAGLAAEIFLTPK